MGRAAGVWRGCGAGGGLGVAVSKAVTKGAHWMPRVASYSLHGQRNGRVDVLPPDAKLQTFHDLAERYDRKRASLQRLVAAYTAMRDEIAQYPWFRFRSVKKTKDWTVTPDMPSWMAKKLDAFHELKDRMNGEQGQLEDYKQAFNEARNYSYERMWIATAVLMLPHDVVGKINDVVATNWDASQPPSISADDSTAPAHSAGDSTEGA
jgi:hypothetical protein